MWFFSNILRVRYTSSYTLTSPSHFLLELPFPFRFPKKKPSVWNTSLQLLVRDSLETLKIIQAPVIALGCLQSLMVRPYYKRHTSATGQGEIALILTRKLPPFWLASIVLEGAM